MNIFHSPLSDDKYTILDTRPPQFTSNAVESSFKHYDDHHNGPEVINVTSGQAQMTSSMVSSGGGGGTILPPDQVIDVSRAPSMSNLTNGGGGGRGGTLQRQSHSGGQSVNVCVCVCVCVCDSHFKVMIKNMEP